MRWRERRGLLLGLGLGATLALPREAAAAPTFGDRPCPDPAAVASGEASPCGDGFFARFAAGPRGIFAHIESVEAEGEGERYEQTLDTAAFAFGGDVTLGGTPWRGVLLGGFLGLSYAGWHRLRAEERSSEEPDFTWRHDEDGGTLTALRLGPALAYYPIPARGLVLDLRPAIGGLMSDEPYGLDAPLYLLELGAGYEPWLGRNLGLGLSARFAMGTASKVLFRRSLDDQTRGFMVEAGLVATFTIH